MRFLLFAILLFLGIGATAQNYHFGEPQDNSGNILSLHFNYGVHFPAADLSDRFGTNYSTGLTVDFLTKKDWIIGLQGALMFSNNVKEDVIATLRNDDGFVVGDEGGLADVPLRMRGLLLGGHFGRIFRLGNAESRSGIRITIGGGLFQHKIKIQDDPIVAITQLSNEYKKGYDRMSNGLALTQFIGYQHLGRKRRINFVIGLELTEAFTESRRSFNFDTREKDTTKRFDLLTGVRVGWTLPFYMSENPDEINY